MIGRNAAIGVALVAGFAVMDAELAAARLVAPYYGTSTTIWALLIGTVLSSLAIGNLIGARLSRRDPRTWLVRLFGLAAVLLALLPRLAPLAMAGSLARFHDGDVGALALAAGEMLVLLAAPIALVGAVGPLVVHAVGQGIAGDVGRELGGLSGRVSAASTFGSLLGTFAAGLALIPWLGTTSTIDVGAVTLTLAAVGLARSQTRVARVTAALVAAAVFALALAVPARTPVPAGRLVYATESRLNHIAVVDTGAERQLRVNDGFAVQSWSYRDGRPPLRDVWTFYGMAPKWMARPALERVLIVGLGGGTTADLYRRLYPNARITGVELDPEVVRVGQEYLGSRLDDVDVVIADARTYVAEAADSRPGSWDVIIIDSFQFPYVPFQLTTYEFFRDIQRCLAPGGVVVVNAGRHRDHRDVVHAIAATLGTVFPHVAAADAPNDSNTLLVATAHDLSRAIGDDGLARLTAFAPVLEAKASQLAVPRPARWPEGTPILTDDRAPVEWLTDRIVWAEL